jgi:hypothetical protein
MIQGHANMQAVPESLAAARDRFNVNIFFTARNGEWTQILREKRVGDRWIRAIQVQGRFTSFKKQKVMCETIDAEFSHDAKGEIDGFLAYSGPKPPLCQ